MTFQVGDLVRITLMPNLRGLVVGVAEETVPATRAEDGSVAFAGDYIVLILTSISERAPGSEVWKHMKTTAESNATLSLIERLLP